MSDNMTAFTADERKAMRERAKELKSKDDKIAAEADVMLKIGQMDASDKEMASTVHALVKTHAPDLDAKTWYGMPSWGHNGKTILFFQSAGKFKVRFATLGFSEHATLDDGEMWPTSYALKKIDKMAQARIVELIKRATGRL
jgi:uncharacterized protein YdhG (YjbR/CyaY superfamily)